MIIEWDSDKAEKNVAKHHVYFEDAAQIFLDEARYIELDYEHSDEEIRYKTIGRVGKILFVVYTKRDEATRLISARKATKKERMKYYVSQNAYLPWDEID